MIFNNKDSIMKKNNYKNKFDAVVVIVVDYYYYYYYYPEGGGHDKNLQLSVLVQHIVQVCYTDLILLLLFDAW